LNIQTEWPLPQRSFENFLLSKYGSQEGLLEIHHYETIRVTNNSGSIIVPEGIQVPENYTIEFYDSDLGQYVTRSNITIAVTNYDYENQIEEDKRNIFVLKPTYLNVVLNDMNDIMPYEKGSTQYVNETLKRGDNIRLYQ